MVCPNCGHPISPTQNFCDNCGLQLKKDLNIQSSANTANNLDRATQNFDPRTGQQIDHAQEKQTTTGSATHNDDAVRSLSDIEKELNAQEQKQTQTQAQAPTQAPKPAQPHASVQLDPEDNPELSDDGVDDRTRVYNFKPEQQSQTPPSSNFQKPPYLGDQQSVPDLGEEVKLDPVTHLPIYPDDQKFQNNQQSEKSEAKENDGLFNNMVQFLKNNIYVDVIAVALTVVMFILKPNYAWILLAIFIVAWFLTSQIIHGNEIKLNKVFKRDKQKDQPAAQTTSNQGPSDNNHYSAQRQEPSKKEQKAERKAERAESHKRNWSQKLLMIAAVVGFIASVTGPFINQFSLSSIITSAANYTANRGGQSVLIMNVSSAIRFICFISPVIVLIAANFRNKGSIRILRIFTLLPSIIYVATYGLFYSNVLNATYITGQVSIGATTQFGASFYVLIATSILSLLLAYTLHPRAKRER